MVMSHLLSIPNALDAVSNGMLVVKLCCDKILQFSVVNVGVRADTG